VPGNSARVRGKISDFNKTLLDCPESRMGICPKIFTTTPSAIFSVDKIFVWDRNFRITDSWRITRTSITTPTATPNLSHFPVTDPATDTVSREKPQYNLENQWFWYFFVLMMKIEPNLNRDERLMKTYHHALKIGSWWKKNTCVGCRTQVQLQLKETSRLNVNDYFSNQKSIISDRISEIIF